MILENEVYMNVNTEEYIRIIDVNNNEDLLFYVILYKKNISPQKYRLSVFKDELNIGIFIKTPDMFSKVVDDKSINDNEKERRDKYWLIISECWEKYKNLLLTEGKRNSAFSIISEEYNIPKSNIKRLFSRFYERGMNKNSLISDYSKSGGKGKERNLTNDVKVGRPKKYDYENEKSGINITEDIKVLFQREVDKYYNKPNQNSLKEVYSLILKEYFSYKYHDGDVVKYEIFEKNKIPTYTQFYYWFKKNRDTTKNIITRQSKRDYELKYRPLLDNSMSEVIGPGSKFQVDATIADIYLVSKFDRDRIIGRPIVYAIIDVFSRLVTGIYVGLEGPSWIGAMMALDNMVADKIEFCKEHEIEIVENQWPSHHLPRKILADRGEFEGYNVGRLINNLGIGIENTPPYRGDLKGIVERQFRTLNTKLKHKTPGSIMEEYRKRGDKDYRLDATLTLEEFTKIYIKLIIKHNNTIVEKYPLDVDMITNNVEPIPTKLWEWGIANKKGVLKTVDREIMRLNVMPSAKASVSRNGIRYKGLFYSSQKAIREQWFINNNVRSIEIQYDPRNMNFIYIPDDDGRNYEKCYLLDQCNQYKDTIIEEVIFYQELQQELIRNREQQDIQNNSNLDKDIEVIVKKAKKEKANNIPLKEQSKTGKIRDIKKNRIIEKELNKELEHFELDKKTSNDCISKTELDEEEENTAENILFEKIEMRRDEIFGRNKTR